MTQTKDIQLVQKPIIQHRIEEIGANVTKRLEDLNIDSLVATNDTVKALKELRAELNKELKSYEDQRKMVKKAITEPYNQFEDIYKTEISEKYTDAVSKLKDKIALVENEIKDKKKESARAYFDELCTAEGIDFLSWDRLGLDINLSTSLKKYKEQINEYVSKVQDELELISTHVHKAEVLAEYKQSLNVAQAITAVQDRKNREQEEAERIRQQNIANRIRSLEALGMKLVDVTNTYEFDNIIWVEKKDVEQMDDEMWMKKLATLQREIESAGAEAKKDEPSQGPPVAPPPVGAPVERQSRESGDQEEKTVTATFRVTGPYHKLKALGQYMRDNGIQYKNI